MASEEEKADEAAAKEFEAKYGHGGIFMAAEDGNIPALRHFLRVAPERVDEKNSYGETPLHLAALNGHVAAAELLLAKGAAVDAKTNGCDTPLHLAALNGHVAAAEFLISKGAVVDAKTDAFSETPLHLAAVKGHVKAAELLLSKGAGVDARSNIGETPLHEAAEKGHVAAAELLLSKGAVMDAKNNRGKTPLDLATERGKTEMVQFLRNPPAKKPSADDGKTPDLSSGKAEMEPLQKDPSSPAGSGAAAAKHQREVSKEEAARELKKAMESGNAKVLKDAIDKAKLHTVSPEEVMEAMDKYIALRESADEAALSPAQEAARELKKAMESGNAKVLKEALDKAKLHKVSQEELMEAMDKYIALRDSADPAAPSKPEEATTSKAESSVKLEPGHGARLAMFSARFNAKNKDTEMKFRAVHKLLRENHYEILMVDAGAGKSFGDDTLKYLRRLGEEKGVMLAVCTSDYGEMTDSPFCTYYELKLAKEYNVDVLPLQVEDNWKPCPPCGEGHRDHSKSALDYIHAVFLPSIVRIDCRKKRVEEIASEIAATLRKP